MTDFIRHRRVFTSGTSYASATPYPTVYTGVTGDTTVIVPSGFILEQIMFLNATANTAVLDCGTSAGGNEVFTGNTINGSGTNNGLTNITVNTIFSTTAPTTLYINDDTAGSSWNSVNVTIFLFFRRTS